MQGIDHIAHAVWDLPEALETTTALDGVEHVWTLESDKWQYRTAYMLFGSDMFTLLSPTSEESFVAEYLERNGEGLHHMGVNVADLESAVDRLTDDGGEVIMRDTIEGVRTEATLHPKSLFGLQLQLIEWDDAVGSTAREHIQAMRVADDEGRL